MSKIEITSIFLNILLIICLFFKSALNEIAKKWWLAKEKRKIEEKNFDIEISKQILAVFNYDQFDSFTDNIFNGYFYREELHKIEKIIDITVEKKFFNTEIQKVAEVFIRAVSDFKKWSVGEFSTDVNPSQIRLIKYLTNGEMVKDYNIKIKKCSDYANSLFDEYKRLYFTIQKILPQAFSS